jgi:hypothetical protein
MPEPTETAVRFVDRDKGIIEGLIVPYFGPIDGDKDLFGTRFSKDTDLALDWFPDGGRPGLYSHGHDDDLEMEVVGREVRSYETPQGRWLEAQLDKAHRYSAEIMELVDKGALALSSGSIDHLVKINRSTRDVEKWPWVEWSLVPNPGNPEALIYSVRSADAISHAPELAVRIVESLDALVPEPEEAPETPEPPTTDPVASVRSLVESMKPSTLHDLAIEMGATCPVREAPSVQPEPRVAITAPADSVRSLSEAEFSDLMREMGLRAADVARDITKH